MKKIVFVLLIGIITITGYAQTNAPKEAKTTNKIFRQEAKETKKLNKLQHQPVICLYLDGFTTVNDVKKVGESSRLGIVIVKEDISGDIFSAMVIPYKKIPKGTRVKLTDIQYPQKGDRPDYFFLVEEDLKY